jgi:prepilin-type N-terminal cleavage/methylation domain-containing protein
MTPARRWRPLATAARACGGAGFTLIETIVVLVILGLALTIVAGFMPRRNVTLELANATSRVVGAMRRSGSMR